MSVGYFLRLARMYGPVYLAHTVYQVKLKRPIRGYGEFAKRVVGRAGLEVGGPSAVFAKSGLIPLYEDVGSLDNCTFAASTKWAEHARAFKFSERKPPGVHHVAEATDLHGIADESYDFVLSSHMLEHTANPLAALHAWRRVLRPGGSLTLLVPHKKFTMDHLRPTTTLAHLIEDYEAGRGEDDDTHFEETLRLHDLTRTPGYTVEDIRANLLINYRERHMHHHVFEPPLVQQALEHVGFSVSLLRTAFPNHIVAVGAKRSIARLAGCDAPSVFQPPLYAGGDER